MKNVVVLTIAFFIFSFSNQTFSQVEILNYPPDELKNCQFQYDDLIFEGGIKENTKTYFLEKEKYSGCAIKYVNQGVSYFAYKMEEGKLIQQIATYENGLLERDFRFKNDVSDGEHQMWFKDGSKYIEETYQDEKPIKLMRWYSNGQLAKEASFKNGKLINELVYNRDGILKSKK